MILRQRLAAAMLQAGQNSIADTLLASDVLLNLSSVGVSGPKRATLQLGRAGPMRPSFAFIDGKALEADDADFLAAFRNAATFEPPPPPVPAAVPVPTPKKRTAKHKASHP